MIIYCEAFVTNPAQQENLIECIEILGGTPRVIHDKISVEYEGTPDECDIYACLFEHYTRHGISIID